MRLYVVTAACVGGTDLGYYELLWILVWKHQLLPSKQLVKLLVGIVFFNLVHAPVQESTFGHEGARVLCAVDNKISLKVSCFDRV